MIDWSCDGQKGRSRGEGLVSVWRLVVSVGEFLGSGERIEFPLRRVPAAVEVGSRRKGNRGRRILNICILHVKRDTRDCGWRWGDLLPVVVEQNCLG